MFLMVSGFINYSQQIVRAARYIGQGYTITLSHANRLPVTIQYPYEKIIALIEHTQENYSDPRNISTHTPINPLFIKHDRNLSTKAINQT
ncbi:hypothetical protein AAZX31_20G037900 [Glycine max]